MRVEAGKAIYNQSQPSLRFVLFSPNQPAGFNTSFQERSTTYFTAYCLCRSRLLGSRLSTPLPHSSVSAQIRKYERPEEGSYLHGQGPPAHQALAVLPGGQVQRPRLLLGEHWHGSGDREARRRRCWGENGTESFLFVILTIARFRCYIILSIVSMDRDCQVDVFLNPDRERLFWTCLLYL